MLGGGAGQDAASFGRLTAKIPARRVPEAVDRLLRLYQEERTARRNGAGVLPARRHRRGRAPRSPISSSMTAEDALPADFIDPGEDHAFNPEVMDGECSA